MKCTHCKSPVNENATRCPHCRGELVPLINRLSPFLAAGFLGFLGFSIGPEIGLGRWLGGVLVTLYSIKLVLDKKYIVAGLIFLFIATFFMQMK